MVTYDTCFLSTLYGHRTERERERTGIAIDEATDRERNESVVRVAMTQKDSQEAKLKHPKNVEMC